MVNTLSRDKSKHYKSKKIWINGIISEVHKVWKDIDVIRIWR